MLLHYLYVHCVNCSCCDPANSLTGGKVSMGIVAVIRNIPSCLWEALMYLLHVRCLNLAGNSLRICSMSDIFNVMFSDVVNYRVSSH